jgi:hypothetical protein
LIRFVASTPSSVATPIAITGLDAGEAVVGIDIRPATGELFAVGVSGTTGRVLRIELTTGAATAVGTPFSTTLPAGASYAVEFTPTVDRIRFTQAGVGGVNLRLNPNNGALAGTDTPISGGSVIGAAYDRSVATATSTTLYAINDDNDSLATIGGVQQQSVAECRCGDHGRAAQRHHRPRVDPRLRHRTLRCTARRRLCGDPGGRYGEPERGAQWADDRQAGDPPLERHRFVHALQPERDAPRRRRLRVFRRLVGSWRTGGLFVPTSPTRLLDTRETPSSKLARNSDVLLTIAGASPVPATGVSSAVVNLTAVDVTAPGFVTIYPTGLQRPLVSSLYADTPGRSSRASPTGLSERTAASGSTPTRARTSWSTSPGTTPAERDRLTSPPDVPTTSLVHSHTGSAHARRVAAPTRRAAR